jgi:hypothetical protein
MGLLKTLCESVCGLDSTRSGYTSVVVVVVVVVVVAVGMQAHELLKLLMLACQPRAASNSHGFTKQGASNT